MLACIIFFCQLAILWSSNVDRTWVCFVYHKSGTELCDKTMRALARRCPLNIYKPTGTELVHKVFDRFSSPTNNYHLIRVCMNTTAYLNEHWRQRFAAGGDRYRSILFLRDPFELIMSAYKYHSEETPVEKWLTASNDLIGYSLDRWLPVKRERYEPLIRCMRLSVKDFAIQARGVHDECQKAMNIFGGKYSFHYMLSISRHFASLPPQHINFSHLNTTALAQFLSRLPSTNHDVSKYGHDLYPSIRLQMCQSVYQLESMAVSKLFEDPAYSRTMHLEDFGIGNVTQFRKAAKTLAKFVVGEEDDWGECSDVSYVVDAMEQNVFIDPNKLKLDLSGSKRRLESSNHRRPEALHITTYLMPKETQAMYKQRIRSDPLFGNYLSKLAAIINKPTNPDRGRLIDSCPALTEQVDWAGLEREVNSPI